MSWGHIVPAQRSRNPASHDAISVRATARALPPALQPQQSAAATAHCASLAHSWPESPVAFTAASPGATPARGTAASEASK